MESKQRYTFGKSEHLKSRKQIELLFNSGRSFSLFPYRMIWMYTKAPFPALQTGFTVSGKQFKKAVDRNRIKRLMREAYRLQKSELELQLLAKQKQLAIFFIYVGNELPEYEILLDKTAAVLKRLVKIINENSLADT